MISIIIPTMNRASLYDRTLPSVIHATKKYNVEVIVVFDGDITNDPRYRSLDNSSIKIFHSHGQGGMSARLLGAANATFQNVLFLDDDDELFNLDLPQRKGNLKLPPLVVLEVEAIWPNAKFVEKYISFFSKSKNLLAGDYIPATFSGMMIERSILLEIPDDIRLADTFQDLLVYNFLHRNISVNPVKGFGRVGFYQNFDRNRVSQNIKIRTVRARSLLNSKSISEVQYKKIILTLLFTKLRQSCYERKLYDLNDLKLGNLLRLGPKFIMTLVLRFIFEIPIFAAFVFLSTKRKHV